MTILAIDFGTKRIGLSLASTPIAEPYGIIANDAKSIDILLDVIAKFSVQKILVGISESEMAVKTRAFIAKLRAATSVTIEEVDETLSSVESGAKMQHLPKSQRRGRRDHLAATIFLQDYLDLL